MTDKATESWGSRIGLILAMAGNAVGIGNFLRFPVQAVQNGGGAFLIPYLVCFLLMGIPLMWAEWAMGRMAGAKGFHSPPTILASFDKRWFWKYVGVFGIFTNVVVAAYYCYLESWTMAYVWHSVSGTFAGLGQRQVAQFFDNYLNVDFGMPSEAVWYYIACVALNCFILSKGLSGGVELVSKFGMPLLILLGVFLAYKGVTLQAGQNGAVHDGTLGLNFLWEPRFDSLANPKVWLAAAGQVFFTLSIGMGSIHCYASYVSEKEDIALNAMSAGWMNEFVEVVLGSSILIPISVGYLGIEKVIELTTNGGLGLGFRTMPYLFQQWGPFLGAFSGFAFFGLLFFAGITSTLAMGTPWMSFLQDEFGVRRQPAAISFGVVVLLLGLPTVYFFNYGVFDEYDYWAGTVSLVVFAMAESILFSWIFGLDRGWAAIIQSAEIKVPTFFRFVLKWVTPIMLILIFLGALVNPVAGDWPKAVAELQAGNGWQMDDGAIVAKLANQDLDKLNALATSPADFEAIAQKSLFVNGSRALLLLTYAAIAFMVFLAFRRRTKAYLATIQQ